MTKQFTEEKKCIVCNRKFLRRTITRVRTKNRLGVRKFGSLTCSKKCARERIQLVAKEKN